MRSSRGSFLYIGCIMSGGGRGPGGHQESSGFPNDSDEIQFYLKRKNSFGPILPARFSAMHSPRKRLHSLVTMSLFPILIPNIPWLVTVTTQLADWIRERFGEA